jgi:hypothetical protein
MRTIIAQLGKLETAQPVAEAQMPQVHLVVVVYVHLLGTMTADAVRFSSLELSMQQIHLFVCCRRYDFRLVIVEGYQ